MSLMTTFEAETIPALSVEETIDAELERLAPRVKTEWWFGDIVHAVGSDWKIMLKQAVDEHSCHGLYLMGVNSPQPALCLIFEADSYAIWKADAYTLKPYGFELPDDAEWELTDCGAHQEMAADILKQIPDKNWKQKAWEVKPEVTNPVQL